MAVTRIETQDLAVARGGRVVLEGVDLRVHAGEVTALVGPSGAGKSSLLRSLVRLDEPAGGRVLVDGRDAAELEPCELRRRVGLVTQAPVMLPGDVRANLAYGLDDPPVAGLAEALAATGLDASFMEREARALSGGESARVAVARALTRDPGVLLLDEPTAALDREAAAPVEALVRSLAERGLAILIVTHDEAQAERVADARIEVGRRAGARRRRRAVTQVVVAAALVVVAIALSRAGGLGLERELAVSAVRAAVQLAAVGAVVTLVFEHAGLAAAFVAVMLGTATLTSGRRLRGVPDAWWRAGAAIAAGAATGIAPMLLTGAFSTEPRELIPVAGILIGGAMVATSVTGRRLTEHVGEDLPAIETRLALGVPVRAALSDAVRASATTGLIPLLDQTKNVGLVTLPGTFVGLVLGGASPAEAARVQLTVLLALLAVEVVAALAVARLVVAGLTAPGERIRIPG